LENCHNPMLKALLSIVYVVAYKRVLAMYPI
jgi:hypothetical protein